MKKVPRKFAGSKKVSTFATPFGNGGMTKVLSHRLNAEFFKIFAEKFADSRKVTTFATPFGNGGIKSSFTSFERRFFEINFQKICRFKKSDYLCNPNRKRGFGHQPKRLVFLAPNLKDH